MENECDIKKRDDNFELSTSVGDGRASEPIAGSPLGPLMKQRAQGADNDPALWKSGLGTIAWGIRIPSPNQDSAPYGIWIRTAKPSSICAPEVQQVESKQEEPTRTWELGWQKAGMGFFECCLNTVDESSVVSPTDRKAVWRLPPLSQGYGSAFSSHAAV